MQDNEQEQGNEEAEVVSRESLNRARLAFKYSYDTICCVCSQEGSEHEGGMDADVEDEDFDMAGDETSDESDSEELEEKGKISCMIQTFF